MLRKRKGAFGHVFKRLTVVLWAARHSVKQSLAGAFNNWLQQMEAR